jgi:hypothetical protein
MMQNMNDMKLEVFMIVLWELLVEDLLKVV